MRVLVVGSGGREHALIWRFGQDPGTRTLHAAPGNPGMAALAACHPSAVSDVAALVALAEHLRPDLVVIGPEAPLAAGLVDALRGRGLRAFGPTRRAARLESSKIFAKRFMARHGIPTAAFQAFDRPDEALRYAARAGRPLVVKADGLAAGKGVVVADGPEEAARAVDEMMIRRVHGSAGARIVIEERLEGREASVLALVHGHRVWPLPPARDYKRARDGDEGPNTGGMGAYAPAPLPPAAAARIVDEVLEPAAAAMAADGEPYTGVLYAGVMLTADGPRVLEFNCRFGDPEAQVLLPLLEGDFGSALLDVLAGNDPRLTWQRAAAVCVVLAAAGYPGTPDVGRPISGMDGLPEGVVAFHAGTAIADGALVTAGGRVLNIVGVGPTPAAARARAYDGVAAVRFDGMRFRTDIALDAASSAAAPEGPTAGAGAPDAPEGVTVGGGSPGRGGMP